MQSSQSNVGTFAFTFASAGIYDFVDNGDTNLHTIIVVYSEGEKCPDSSKIYYALNTTNIELFGLASVGNLITDPQWGIIAGIVVATFIILLILIYVFISM